LGSFILEKDKVDELNKKLETLETFLSKVRDKHDEYRRKMSTAIAFTYGALLVGVGNAVLTGNIDVKAGWWVMRYFSFGAFCAFLTYYFAAKSNGILASAILSTNKMRPLAERGQGKEFVEPFKEINNELDELDAVYDGHLSMDREAYKAKLDAVKAKNDKLSEVFTEASRAFYYEREIISIDVNRRARNAKKYIVFEKISFAFSIGIILAFLIFAKPGNYLQSGDKPVQLERQTHPTYN